MFQNLIKFLIIFVCGFYSQDQSASQPSWSPFSATLGEEIFLNEMDNFSKPSVINEIDTGSDSDEESDEEVAPVTRRKTSLGGLPLYSRRDAIAWNKKFPTISAWCKACEHLPKNRSEPTGFQSPFDNLSPLEQQSEFQELFQTWMKYQADSLSPDAFWQDSNDASRAKPSPAFFNINQVSMTFVPFAQKLIAQPGDQFYFHGDLHGDIFSLLEQIKDMQSRGIIDENFRIIPNNVWMIFLGDYVDRGNYGCEVMYTLLRLAVANPDRVILVRGNHEDSVINANSSAVSFKTEVNTKFFNFKNILKIDMYHTIIRIYSLMPVVLYLGCPNVDGSVIYYAQCCHGGIEFGYDPRNFLNNRDTRYQRLGTLERFKFVEEIIKNCNEKQQDKKMRWENVLQTLSFALHFKIRQPGEGLGFLWTDFNVLDTAPIKVSDRGCSIFEFGKQATEDVLLTHSTDQSKIIAILRGHQHGDDNMMKKLLESNGLYKLWLDTFFQKEKTRDVASCCRDYVSQNNVFTFNHSPENAHVSNFDFNWDTYAVLTVDNKVSDWNFQIFNPIVFSMDLLKKTENYEDEDDFDF